MRLQQFLEQQAQTDDSLIVRVDARQPMAVADVKSSERVVERDGRVEQVAERDGEHADAVEGNDAARRDLILLQLGAAREVAFYQFGDFGVAGEAQHHLVNDVLEHKVLVVVGGSQLHVLKHQFVHYQVRAQYVGLQVAPHLVVLEKPNEN